MAVTDWKRRVKQKLKKPLAHNRRTRNARTQSRTHQNSRERMQRQNPSADVTGPASAGRFIPWNRLWITGAINRMEVGKHARFCVKCLSKAFLCWRAVKPASLSEKKLDNLLSQVCPGAERRANERMYNHSFPDEFVDGKKVNPPLRLIDWEHRE